MDYAQLYDNSVYDSPCVMEHTFLGGTQFYFSAGSSDLGSAFKRIKRVCSSLVSAFSVNDSANHSLGNTFSERPIGRVVFNSDEIDSSRDLETLNFVSQRLEYIYCNDAASSFEASHSRLALRGVIDAVEDLLEVADYATLDDLLGAVAPDSLKKMTSVAFLRSSYRARNKLPNWGRLYSSIWIYLKDTNQDPERALRGMVRDRDAKFA